MINGSTKNEKGRARESTEMVMKDGVFDAYGIRNVVAKIERRRHRYKAGFGKKPSGFAGKILAIS